MITYIPYVPIAKPQIHYGGGIVVYVFLSIYIAILVYLIIEIFKRLKDL